MHVTAYLQTLHLRLAFPPLPLPTSAHVQQCYFRQEIEAESHQIFNNKQRYVSRMTSMKGIYEGFLIIYDYIQF